MTAPATFLVDNGSLRPEATLRLRELAADLSIKSGLRVEPVSLLHSHKIAAVRINDEAATIVKRRMRELLALGQRDFCILPLFLGPSLAITDYLPSIADELREGAPELRVTIADPIAGPEVESPDPRLAEILADQIEQITTAGSVETEQIALVDHGTPIKPVNTLRNAVARQLSARLGRTVTACSMERREGPEYAFNEPLLEKLRPGEAGSSTRLLLSMFFLLPGRHAGPGGDVAAIADRLTVPGCFESVRISSLLGEHPILLEILNDRLAEAIARRGDQPAVFSGAS